MLDNKINETNINLLVKVFYSKVLKDEIISPFFIDKLGNKMDSEEWQKHIVIISDFWLTVSTGKGTYNGSPFAPHMQINGLKKESFERWLKLFFETLDEIFIEEIANSFKKRSSIIASNFIRNLGIYN